MEPQNFHLGDILTVSTGKLLSLDGIGGLYKILSFMTGTEIYTHQIPRATEACRPEIRRQHPFLESGEMQYANGMLIEMLKTPSGKREPEMLVRGWLCKLTAQFGETFPVWPLPPGLYEPKDPVDEAVEMFGDDRVLTYRMPSSN
jgi:hypothetical protein